MQISNINNVTKINPFEIDKVSRGKETRNATFENMFQSALQMVKETNNLTNIASEEEIAFAMGLKDNTHDLQVAQQKANLSLQYTVAVRNNVLDAYKEIMNLQF